MDVIKYWSNALVFTWRQHESIEIYKTKQWEIVRERVYFLYLQSESLAILGYFCAGYW